MGIQKIYYAIAVLFIFFFSFTPSATAQDVGDEQTGIASWYGAKYHGRRTSSGEIYNRHKLTAAHNGLPLGTKVKVTNTATGKSVIVKVNDRGPFKAPRVIDLSEAAFKSIASRKVGLTSIKVEVIELPAYFLAKRAAEENAEPKAEEKVLVSTAAEPGISVLENQESKEPVVTAAAMPVGPNMGLTQKVYVVQAGAFSSQDNAEQQINKLRKIYQKMPIARLEETVNQKKMYRVLAGRFNDRATAEQTRKDLVKKGFQGMVREITEPAPMASSL